MKYQKLGKSTLNISRLGFGCMSLSNNQKDNTKLIRDAIDKGFNFFDTADLYDKGWNEKSVGKALGNQRKDIILASKVGNVWNEDGNGWHWNASKQHIINAIEDSLKRLGTDYLDLYQLHGGMIEDPIEETIEAFEQLVKDGKIRYYGISSIRPNVIRTYVEQSNIVSVMLQYSLLDRRPEENILSLLEQNEIGILARGSLAQGLLAGKPPRSYLGHDMEDVSSLINAMNELDNGDPAIPKIALDFVLSHDAISSAVIGIRTQQQLEQLEIAIKNSPVDNAKLEKINKIIAPHFYTAHR